MLRLATGIRPVRNNRGFTLLELLVVIALAGLLVSLVALNLGGVSGPQPAVALRELADRITLAHEEATLSGRSFGLQRRDDGLEFMVLALDPEARRAVWRSVDSDRLLARTAFAEPYVFAITVEGVAAPADSTTPLVLLLPDGEMTPFRISLSAPGAESAHLVGSADGGLRLELDR